MSASDPVHRPDDLPFVYRTFVCRARITPVGHRRIAEVLTLTRQLHNAALEERVEAWRRCRQSITWQDQFKSLTTLRRDPLYADLRDLDLRIQRAPLQRVDRAFRGFFRRCKASGTPGFPRFRPASRWRSIELNDASPGMVRRRGRHTVLVVKGLPPIRIRTSRPLPDPAALKTVRIVRKPVRVQASRNLCPSPKHPLSTWHSGKRPQKAIGIGSEADSRNPHRNIPGHLSEDQFRSRTFYGQGPARRPRIVQRCFVGPRRRLSLNVDDVCREIGFVPIDPPSRMGTIQPRK